MDLRQALQRAGWPDDRLPADRCYVVVRRDDSGYRPLEKVVEDGLTTHLLLRQAEREWKDLHARYGHLQEFIVMVREAVA